MRVLLVILAVFGLFVFPGITMTVPSGNDRNLNVDDFFKHPKIGKRFNELWFYAFIFDSGEKVYVSYSIMNPPLIEGKCGADISVYNFEGKNYSVARGLPQSILREIHTTNTIRIGENFCMKGLPGAGHQVYYETSKNEGFLLDLTFTSVIAGKVRGDGIFRSGDIRFAQYIHIPYGRVSGILRIGGISKEVNGYGYMEHTWQNKMVSKLAKFAIQIFGNGNIPSGRTIIGTNHLPATPFGYSLDISSGEARVVFPRRVLGDNRTLTGNSPVPGRFQIDWISSSKEPSKFFRNDQQKYLALSTIDGFFKKKVAKLAMGGEIAFYRGEIDRPRDVMSYNVMAIE